MSAAEDEEERAWLARVNRGDLPQLTARAVVVGMLLGGVMALSNLYVVLKTGWSLGVTVTAGILGFGVFRLVAAAGVTRRPFGLLENSAVCSVASSAGYMTGGGNMAALPALVMLTGTRPDPGWMIAWFAVIAALGVCTAIPIKRQLVNVEKLPFPTGTATAETLRSLHTAGASTEKARWLGLSAAFGAVLAWLRDAGVPFRLPGSWAPPIAWAGYTAKQWTMTLDASFILVGGGALISFRTGWSLLLGAILNYVILAPRMVEAGVITRAFKYKDVMQQFSLWPGAAMLLSSGLLAFALQWRSVARSFTAFRGARAKGPADAVESPPWWFAAGYAALGPMVVFLMGHLFGMPWWSGVLALPLAVAMGVVAARVTGETDVTPTKALGPVTQGIYGAVLPGNLPANLMGANVTGGVGLHAADLLTDMRAGWLLGANPRQQMIGQLFGVLAGAVAVVPVFNLLVPDPEKIGGEEFPAPGVQVWAGVSKVLVGGLTGLATEARVAALVFFALGIALVLAERLLPKRVVAFLPAASGLGLGMVLPGANCIAMFVGAAIAEGLRRRRPDLHERGVTPIASGFIAGESLMGVLVAILIAVGVLKR